MLLPLTNMEFLMRHKLTTGEELNITTPAGKSTEVVISLADGTVIKTVLPSRVLINIIPGSAFDGINIEMNILRDGPIGLSD